MPYRRLKALLPDQPVPMRIWRGPFRGARVIMAPRSSMRKVLGLYEQELNGWLTQVLPRVRRVLDVGANDGYFTFGCAAAFQRLGIAGEITCFEPQPRHVEFLRESVLLQRTPSVQFDVEQTLVGNRVADGVTTLDALRTGDRDNTLIRDIVNCCGWWN